MRQMTRWSNPVPNEPTHIAGIFCSDAHFCHKPPPARSVEPSWLAAQKRVIDQLGLLKRKYNCPIFFAGDLLDRHDQPAWFINWLMIHLRGLQLHTIPGQHDIPNHQYSQLNRSAYWTLVEGGVIQNLSSGLHHEFGNLIITAFPWNFPIKPPAEAHGLMLQVALVHAYIFTERTGYFGAPAEKLAGKYLPKLKGYDCAFFGDNHTGWYSKSFARGVTAINKPACSIFNCGVLIRRLYAEYEYKPRVALLHASGVIEPHYLDVSADKFSLIGKAVEDTGKTLKLDLSKFVTELANLRDCGQNWTQTVRQEMEKHKLPADVKTLVLKALGEIKEEVWPR